MQIATDLDYKLGRVAAQRAMGVASLDLGRYDEARDALLDALMLARQIAVDDETLACKVGLARLYNELGDSQSAARHSRLGLELAQNRDPERYGNLVRAELAQALATTKPDEARQILELAASEVAGLPVPRRTQVQLALAWGWRALGEPVESKRHARAVLQTAGSRGFRLLSLQARGLMCELTEGEEQDTHRAVGRDLIRDFTSSLPDALRRSFLKRPFVQFLVDDLGDDVDEDVEFEAL